MAFDICSTNSLGKVYCNIEIMTLMTHGSAFLSSRDSLIFFTFISVLFFWYAFTKTLWQRLILYGFQSRGLKGPCGSGPHPLGTLRLPYHEEVQSSLLELKGHIKEHWDTPVKGQHQLPLLCMGPSWTASPATPPAECRNLNVCREDQQRSCLALPWKWEKLQIVSSLSH